MLRVVVVGASSGLGRYLGVGLARRGASVALAARRAERLDAAVTEAGERALAVPCDVTDPTSCRAAIAEAASRLGGIDALVYSPGIGVLARIEDTDQDMWRRVFDVNVTGASLVTAAALPHLRASGGTAIYLSSVIGSETRPWPGLGSYAVSKAALDKLIEAWRSEHRGIGFTRVVVGECGGPDAGIETEFAADWDPSLIGELMPTWLEEGYMTGNLIRAENLLNAIDMVVNADDNATIRSITVAPR